VRQNAGHNNLQSAPWNTGAEGNSSVGRQPGRMAPPAAGSQMQELEFEELALRASSVVMIGIHDGNGDIVGSGSGIMIGRDGYILTNDHVARGGRFYSVRIENDDNMYKTDEIIKYNSLLDLAVIRIDRPLQPLPIYRGRKPLVRGQKVVAIGSPLGLFNSVSNGIISGFRRVRDVDMIQFTAPISHGSSGGAVLNMYGEVIGVSTAGMDEGQNINLAVGYEFINTFIKGFQ
ncbi:MAG: S1C family serine protease, partial [Acetatifactor sp.]|nr:S1C family serine protease [Acetatifactor sp.]